MIEGDDAVRIQEQIEIERARRIRNAARATLFVLQVQQSAQQRPRIERGVDARHGVEIVRLFRATDGCRAVDRREGGESCARQVFQTFHGGCDLACRITEVSADADPRRMPCVRRGHAAP